MGELHNGTEGSRLARIESRVDKLENRVTGVEQSLPDKMELAIRRHSERQGKGSREMSGWVISLIGFGLFVIFGFIELILKLGS